MKLTVAQIYDAVNALIAICNTPRVIPAMAKYKLARMHDALEPTWDAYEKKRQALVMKYGEEKFQDPETKLKSFGWGVDPKSENGKAYAAEWGAMLEESHEINVTPITMTMLGDDPKGIEFVEFKQLAGLIVE